ncbi:MAG: hypothetical protein A2157_16550 [Deltaproteobacteria bacterium RBG_16_47_11]|nr:MAG: hypothetical protein A2157_16550 [Deltaproteobacteria bacterium RBG_16_47_11]
MLQRRRHGRSHAPRPNHFKHPKSYKVICSGCGKEVITSVFPPSDKKLLCMECFSQAAPKRLSLGDLAQERFDVRRWRKQRFGLVRSGQRFFSLLFIDKSRVQSGEFEVESHH